MKIINQNILIVSFAILGCFIALFISFIILNDMKSKLIDIPIDFFYLPNDPINPDIFLLLIYIFPCLIIIGIAIYCLRQNKSIKNDDNKNI